MYGVGVVVVQYEKLRCSTTGGREKTSCLVTEHLACLGVSDDGCVTVVAALI